MLKNKKKHALFRTCLLNQSWRRKRDLNPRTELPVYELSKPAPSSIVAEEEGFEPSHRVTSLRAFQARPFSLLGIPPWLKRIYIDNLCANSILI